MTDPSAAGSARNIFVFWQRTYSIDRAPLIAQLAKNPGYRVIFVSMERNRRSIGAPNDTRDFGAAQVITEPDPTVMEELATLPSANTVHLVEGAGHEIWNNEAVIDSWITMRPRVLLLEESWNADGGVGRRHTRALRSLSRLGGKLIGAVLVSGSHSAYEFGRLGFAEVFPFNHLADTARPQYNGSPTGQQCSCMVSGEQGKGGQVTSLIHQPTGAHHVGSMRRASRQSAVSVPPTVGREQPENMGPGAIAVDGAGPLPSALDTTPEEAEPAAVWTTSQLSADSGAGYLEAILKYLDHPGMARPQAPWQSSVKVRYRRAQ